MKRQPKQPQEPYAPPEDSVGYADLFLERLISQASKQGIKLVRFLFCDTSSVMRGKCVTIRAARDKFQSGIGLVKGTMAMNILDQLQKDSGFGATGEVRLVPDLGTFKILPYTQASAAVLCDLVDLNGTPWPVCPRAFLKRQIALAEALGIFIRAAFEPEFIAGVDVLDGYGVDGGDFVPIDRGQCFSTESMNCADPLISKIVESLEMQGLEVEQYYPELGHGQHEISIKHAPALEAADRYLLMRETIRGTASQMDYTVTFTPKLSADDPGNGCHLHLSAWDKGYENNLFAGPHQQDQRNSEALRAGREQGEQSDPRDQEAQKDPGDQDKLSDLAKQFIAGIIEHLPGLVALTCASVNSYRRLEPKSWASAYTCWGLENREAAVRVPSTYWGMEAASTNIEVKCVDNTANPYLALGAVIACGLDGVRRKLMPPPPVQGDPSELSQSEMLAAGVSRLPQSLNDALTELVADEYLIKTLGLELANTFTVVKSSEAQAFLNDSAFEFNMHKLRY